MTEMDRFAHILMFWVTFGMLCWIASGVSRCVAALKTILKVMQNDKQRELDRIRGNR